MKTERIKELVNKYNSMLADPAELKEIEQLIEKGIIDIEDLNELHAIEERVLSMESATPSLSLDDKFYDMLQKEKRPANAFSWKKIFAWPELAPRLAFASVTLILGLAAGYFLRTSPAEDPQIATLGREVSELKEVMMLSLLERESVTDRLKAVSLTQEMDQASQKVTGALLQTLNSDSDINVRLAALDALRIYSGDSKVRQELIRSISKQDSPLVQIALAELMAQIQAKSSVKELEKILKNENTPTDVRKKIEQSLKVLI
ncbi:MAG TPA: HEAT repeat domain-containing protein [Chryseolinea sp.]|nr:HEAT repeat domain-containing protein [Chryseolinea sp.]